MSSAKSRLAGGKVLVTGGAGFLGSHLCDALLGLGHEVICLDNFISGSRDNIKHLDGNPKFKLIEHDVSLPTTTPIEGLTGIFHFASPASPNPASSVSYMAHPIETLMANSIGAKNMLDLDSSNNCQIIFASTSEVYGDPEVHPQTEDYVGHVSPNGPRSCYDESKRFMEALAFAYYRTHQTKIKVIRIFNTYGPRMMLDEGRFIPTIVDSYLHKKTFLQYGDGSVTRSFCYVDDLLAGVLKVFEREVVGEVINLGNEEEYSVKETINVLEELTGEKLVVEMSDALADDPQRRQPDLTKARRLLDWSPKVGLKEGLRKMLASYEK
ncbi:MAG: GDP-mannose 4,6-dehydratase [bacterium]